MLLEVNYVVCNYVVKQCIFVLSSQVSMNLLQWTFYKYEETSEVTFTFTMSSSGTKKLGIKLGK